MNYTDFDLQIVHFEVVLNEIHSSVMFAVVAVTTECQSPGNGITNEISEIGFLNDFPHRVQLERTKKFPRETANCKPLKHINTHTIAGSVAPEVGYTNIENYIANEMERKKNSWLHVAEPNCGICSHDRVFRSKREIYTPTQARVANAKVKERSAMLRK